MNWVLGVQYYGRCKDGSQQGPAAKEEEERPLFLERMRCRGHPVPDFKTKSVIRTDVVMEHQVHYAVVSLSHPMVSITWKGRARWPLHS